MDTSRTARAEAYQHRQQTKLEVASNYGDYTEKKERTQKFKTRLEAAKSGFSGAEGSHTAKKWKIGNDGA